MGRALAITAGFALLAGVTSFGISEGVVSVGKGKNGSDPHLSFMYFHPDELPFRKGNFKPVSPYATSEKLTAILTKLQALKKVCPDPKLKEQQVQLGSDTKSYLCLNLGAVAVTTKTDAVGTAQSWLRVPTQLDKDSTDGLVDLAGTFNDSSPEECKQIDDAMRVVARRVIVAADPTAYSVAGSDYRFQIVIDISAPSKCDEQPAVVRTGGPD